MRRLLLGVGMVAALMGGAAHHGDDPCRVAHVSVIGAQYRSGVWARDGRVIGHAFEEDSAVTAGVCR